MLEDKEKEEEDEGKYNLYLSLMQYIERGHTVKLQGISGIQKDVVLRQFYLLLEKLHHQLKQFTKQSY